MPTDNLFTPEVIGGHYSQSLVPFGTAVFALEYYIIQIKTLETDVRDLKARLYDLSTKFEADLLARKAQGRKGSKG